MMIVIQYAKILHVLADLSTALGLPALIWSFYRENKRQRKEREVGTYDRLDERYTQFLELCSKYPELDVVDPPLNKLTLHLSDTPERKREKILYLILISIIERAVKMYRETSSEIRDNEYQGWLDYINEYSKSPNFRHMWIVEKLGEQFETGFVAIVNGYIQKGGDNVDC